MSRSESQSVVDTLPIMYKEFVNDGYIIVQQDIRGLHNCEGTFVMNRPIVGPLNNTGIDESTDAYDAIDWLVKNVPESNGKVGVDRLLLPRLPTLASEINPHPALKAAVPQSPMVDGWMGDDWFHNGAFRTGSLDFAVSQSTAKAEGGGIARGPGDDYTCYLQAGSMGDLARQLGIDQYPFVQKLFQNPAYTEFWSGAGGRQMACGPAADRADDDRGRPVGPGRQLRRSRGLQGAQGQYEGSGLLHLAIGPWRHSGANHYGYELGDVIFTGDTAQEWRTEVGEALLRSLSEGRARSPHAAALTYATGINGWQASPRWPMGTQTPLYLTRQRHQLRRGRQRRATTTMCPTRPSRCRSAAADQLASGPVEAVAGARPALRRRTARRAQLHDAPLTKPVHIMGAPQVELFAATSGTDSDWVVKLIDVYPNETPEGARRGRSADMSGYELPIGIEIFRGRYVDSFAKPRALRASKVEHYSWACPT